MGLIVFSDKLIKSDSSQLRKTAVDSLILLFFTGRQGVCVVPMETTASGKSRFDPGCQFGG